jgi:prevent-host-death family protein
MLHVKIGELRNKLSALLRRVKAGETILVYDRDKPIARIQPVAEKPPKFKSDKERLAWLIAQGIVLPPKNPNADWSFLWTEPLPKAKASVLEALLEERREGR